MSVMGAAMGRLKRSGSGIGKLGLPGQFYNFWRVDSRSEACHLAAKVWGPEGTPAHAGILALSPKPFNLPEDCFLIFPMGGGTT